MRVKKAFLIWTDSSPLHFEIRTDRCHQNSENLLLIRKERGLQFGEIKVHGKSY